METKSLCAKIPIELHHKIRQKQEESGLVLNQYLEKLITEYYEMEKRQMSENGATRTLAIQIPEELFERFKRHIKEKGKSQKAYLIDLIQRELATEETTEETMEETTQELIEETAE